MPRTWRQRRGQATARLVAEYLRPLAPDAEATPSAYAGTDIQHVPWDVEVKAPREESWTHGKSGAGHHAVPLGVDPERCAVCDGSLKHQRFSLTSAVKQAAKRRKPEHILPPMVVLRPDGTGDASVGDFLVIRSFADDREVLAELLSLRELMGLLFKDRRRERLEYTETHGGWMSPAARAELEELRAQG